ncbi:MAG: rod shape-determining protein MreD [Chloroflexi bacterium]|nr:rod shape-determining protein MreD [Chloroflexota bacterium]
MAIYYIGFPFLMIVAVLDATFMQLFRLWGGAPSLMLMVMVSWALVADLEDALPWAVMGGVMRDLLSVAPTGSSAVAFVIIVIIIDRIFPKISWHNIAIPPPTILVASYIYGLMMFGFLRLAGWDVPFFNGLWYIILPGAVINVMGILVVFRLIGGVNNFLRPQRASMLR